MGLFSSSKKTYVSSTTINVIGTTGDITKSAAINSIFKKTNLTDSILNAYQNSLQLKLHQIYRYAQQHYTLGLPQGTMDQGIGDSAAVKTVIETQIGNAIIMAYCILSSECTDEFAFPHLIANRGLVYDTGEVTIHPFYTGPYKLYFSDAKALATDSLQINYSYMNGTGTPVTVSETITYIGLRPNAPYYHVCYYRLNANGSVQPAPQFWNYCPLFGDHPTLALTSTLSLVSPFFPIVPLRRNNVDMTSDAKANTELFISSKKMLKKLGLDFQSLGDSINENPDVGEIDHVYLYFGVDLQSTVKSTQKYLTEFFAYLSGLSNKTYQDYVRWERNGKTTYPPHNTLTIEDAGYKAEITYNYIRVRVISGNIGAIGSVTRTNVVRDREYWRTDSNFGWYGQYYENSSVVFRLQVAKNTYKEVEVRGLEHVNYIYKNHSVQTSVEDSIKDDYSFIIPLNKHVYDSMSVKDRTNVAHDGIKMVFNSYKTVKSKWYESIFFQFVMIVVAVAALVVGAWQVSLAVTASSTATEILMVILTTILEMVAWTAAFKIASNVLGAELTLILATMMAMYAIGSGIKAGSLKGAPYATELLQASTGLSKAATENISDELADLQGLSKEQQAEQDRLWDELVETRKLLGVNEIIDPMSFTNLIPTINSYESPDEYYYRTVHSGNIGVLSLDAPTNYVDYMLTLPQAPGYSVV